MDKLNEIQLIESEKYSFPNLGNVVVSRQGEATAVVGAEQGHQTFIVTDTAPFQLAINIITNLVTNINIITNIKNKLYGNEITILPEFWILD